MYFQKSMGQFCDRSIVKSDQQIYVVIFADDKVLKTLRFFDQYWIIEGRLSTHLASLSGIEIEEPHIYYRNIGYLDPSIVYAVLDDNCPEDKWEDIYHELDIKTECSVSDVCPFLGLSCEKCKARC